MRIIFYYAIRELLNHRRFSLFFICNLALGLVGFLVLLLTRDAVQNDFSTRLREMLNADIIIQTRIPPTPKDDAWIASFFQQTSHRIAPDFTLQISRMVDTVTMLRSSKRSRLVRVLGVEDGYPLYGDFKIAMLDEKRERKKLDGVTQVKDHLQTHAEVWMDENIANDLQLSLQQNTLIGEKPFTFTGQVLQHPSINFGFTGMLPTIYVGRNALHDTGLLALGSRVLWKYAIRLQSSSNAPDDKGNTALHRDISSKLVEAFQKAIRNTDQDADKFRIILPEDTGERMRELTDRISGFMNLISLIGLFFSGLGLGYLFRYYANQRLQTTAIARCLGMTEKQSQALLFVQLLLLTGIALCITFLIGLWWSHFGLSQLSQWFGRPLSVELLPSTLLLLIIVAVASNAVFTLPIWISMRHIKPAILLRLLPGEPPCWEDDPTYNLKSNVWARRFSILPAVFFLWLAAVYLVDWYMGTLFFGIMLLVIVLFGLSGLVLLKMAQRLSMHLSMNFRLALRALVHRRTGTLSGFVAIALGVFLMAILPQMIATLRQEIRTPQQSVLPAFFLFDIQSNQLSQLQDWIQQQQKIWPDIKLGHLSPQIRARLIKINERDVNTDDVTKKMLPQHRQFIRQGVNISYREGLSNSETLLAGQPLKPVSAEAFSNNTIVKISLEERYATRLGVSMDDTITFLVHGIEIKTKVANIRRVLWNSFQPNFFIQFPTGVLEDAPKIWVANLSGIPPPFRLTLQSQLSEQFSNISAIDVSALIEDILQLGSRVILAVMLLAGIAIIAGLTVIISVALTEVEEAQYEFGLIKALGGGRRHLRQRAFAQFTCPGFCAAIMGIIFAVLVSDVLAKLFLQSQAVYPLTDLFILLLATTIILTLLFLGMVQRILNIKANVLLNAE